MPRNLSNKPLRRLWLGTMAVAMLLLAGCHGQAHGPANVAVTPPVATSAAMQYTCPMHPQIVREAPGSCPICGMDLVPKATGAGGAPAVADLTSVSQAPNAAVLSAVATVRPAAAGTGADTLTLPGVVAYDPRRSRAVAARFGGRIERLLVRYNYQPVRQGQLLLELYSPELVTAEQELIFLLENDAANTALLAGARQKLRLLGLTDGQLRGLARTRQPSYRVAIFSPYDGYVVETAVANAPAPAAPAEASPDAADGMGGSATGGGAATPAAPTQLSLTEGTYVTTGQALFQVINTDQVWGVFQPTPPELARLHPGQALRVVAEGTALPPITARLDLVEPEFRAGASVVAVRVYLANSKGLLRRGQRLTGQLVAGAASTMTGTFWLPRAAVVDLGTRQVAFVRRGGTFVPLPVQVGERTASLVHVLGGLAGTEDVAANGQYLIDSEGFTQTAVPTVSAHD
ncbi:efflux RND transporter periplasmic adaptor subunit [Hymenobacter sp. H14-R3]|uniref:efflux RND transporter periplasmic adaptor subunit n=1 Tax=Hymenobacter sp. H14-R3 TaxID=3046308 RepID=UPI0024BB865F|nr:efflux RND transporter periplasmic adaptor subunit [Hymenobacter sp. H14-R3]MDJ0368052.1 efflux RND transporter periplasmic adaptor subunit [Hymenobacter sp. H14-R3]